jgi:phospholipase/lecithinase/hemolysin
MKFVFVITNLIFSLNAFKEPTDLYIVGDILSDTGNAYEITGGRRPNAKLYPIHRYSNGLIWNDYLAEKYPNLNIKNYAVGGATTDNDMINLEPDSPSVKEQALKISEELSKPTSKKCRSNKYNKRIVIIWAGANDFIANATIASKETIPNLAKITSILKQTKKFDNILLFNFVNLVQTPFGNILPPNEKEGLNKVIIQLNQALVKAINDEQAKDPSQKLTLIDANKITSKLISIPSSKSHNWEPFGYCVDRKNPLTTNICEDPNNFFFWDQQHPNTESHKRISSELDTIFNQLGYI